MLRQQNNRSEVVISSEGVATASLPSAGTVVTNDNLPSGAICIVDEGNRRLSAAAFGALANGSKFRIAQSLGTAEPLYLSNMITVGHYTTQIRAHRAATEQISRIGYDGGAGVTASGTNALPDASDTGYFIKIRKNDNDAANRSQPTDIFAPYTTSGSATQSELAFGLHASLIKNLDLEPANGYIRPEVLIDTPLVDSTACSGLTADTGAITFTNGSKTISAALDIDGGGDLVAGSYLRIDADASGEALTDPVYRVDSVDSANDTATLSTAFQGTTAAIASANVHHIPSATGSADNFGIQLTGIEADFDVAAFRDFYKNRFSPTFSDKDIRVSLVQGASEGVGAWQRVRMDEYFAQWGNEGQDQMIDIPPRARDQQATANVKYSALSIQMNDTTSSFLSQAATPGSILVYLELDTADPAELTNANSGFEAAVTVLGAGGATDFDEVT